MMYVDNYESFHRRGTVPNDMHISISPLPVINHNVSWRVKVQSGTEEGLVGMH